MQECVSRLCGAILSVDSNPDLDTCRDEQQVRANLETLVDTSPVGVVVLDARTGKAVSLNREAKRIVRGLRMPGNPVTELLEMMRCRRGDGREVGLAELSLGRQLSTGETPGAEEIELSIPGGRSVTALVSATPIQGQDGGVDSVVVTMQDLAPLKELERMAAEFLGIVGHELRAPLTSIKGSSATVLATPRGLGAVEMLQFFRIIDEQADRMSRLIGDLLDRRVTFTVPAASEEAGNGAANSVPEGPLPPGRHWTAPQTRAEPGPFALGELAIDHDRRLVTVAGRRVNLTATEYELLRLLSSNAGRVLTYRSLLRQAWGNRYQGSVDPKLVHAVVKRLRDKLGEDAARPAYILNERGIGYRMRAPGDP